MATPKKKTETTEIASTDVVQADAILAPGAQRPKTELSRYLQSVKAKAAEESEDASDTIVERILNAASVDDLFKSTEVTAAKDVLFTPLRIFGVKWSSSDFEQAEGAFAIIECRNLRTGDDMIVTCGARSVMAMLYKLDGWGAFPIDLEFEQTSRPTAAGYYPLALKPTEFVPPDEEEKF